MTAAVVPADVDGKGSLVVPTDPLQVGWWSGGARVGDPYGGVVLAGHVDSRRYGLGALAELARASVGQQVRVSSGGMTQTYRITQITRVPKARLAAGTDTFRQDVAPRLVLITCGGAFDTRTHTYADNVVVTAVPES
jgi:sortase (surface protein transpeptidase)